MKRTILALAVASLSFTAFALPPPGGGPPTPLNVNVTNSVLPVEVSNADPIPLTVTSQPKSTIYSYEMAATCPFGNQCVAEGIFDVRRNDEGRLLVMFPVTSFPGAYFGPSYASNYEVELSFGPDSWPVLEFGIPSGSGTLNQGGVSFGVTGHLTDEAP